MATGLFAIGALLMALSAYIALNSFGDVRRYVFGCGCLGVLFVLAAVNLLVVKAALIFDG